MSRRESSSQPSFREQIASALTWFLRDFTYRGRTVVVTAVLLTLLVALCTWLWRSWAPRISTQAEYLVTADRVSLTTPPGWLECKVVEEALDAAGFSGSLSLLDSNLVEKLINALELHPWIDEVSRVEKRYPADVQVEVTYRMPVAAIETNWQGSEPLSPIDAKGVRLPANDLPKDLLVRLPRIRVAQQTPLVGQTFAGPEIEGALGLVTFLGDQWHTLHLLRIIPRERPEIRGEERIYLYDLLTQSGATVHWGAAPGHAPPDEPLPELKLERLREFAAERGSLQATPTSGEVNLRRNLEKVPHVADRE